MDKFLQFSSRFGAYLFTSRQGYNEEKEERTRPIANGVRLNPETNEQELIIEQKTYKVTVVTRSFFQLTKEGVLKLYVSRGDQYKPATVVSETIVDESTFTDPTILSDLIIELDRVYKRRDKQQNHDVQITEKTPLSDVLAQPIAGVDNLNV